MKKFKKVFMSRTKEERDEILKKMKKYRDRYMPVELYSWTTKGKEMNAMIAFAEQYQNG